MANAQVTIKRVEFILEDKLTHCNVLYTSNEPNNPAWGGGWKTKTFPPAKHAISILTEDISNYISWSNGRGGVNKDEEN